GRGGAAGPAARPAPPGGAGGAAPRRTSIVVGCAGLRRATRAKSCHDTTVSPLTLRMRSPGTRPALAPAPPDVTLEMAGSRYGLSASTKVTRAAVSVWAIWSTRESGRPATRSVTG